MTGDLRVVLPVEVDDLPVAVQATLEPHQAAIAWWGGDEDALAWLATWLPGSRPATVTLALPVRSDAGRRVEARDVPCVLSDLVTTRERLRELTGHEDAAPRDRAAPRSASVSFWQEWARHEAGQDALAARMPVAAHCATVDGEHISSAIETIRHADTLLQSGLMTHAADLNIQLRPYQAYGVAWLTRLTQHGPAEFSPTRWDWERPPRPSASWPPATSSARTS